MTVARVMPGSAGLQLVGRSAAVEPDGDTAGSVSLPMPPTSIIGRERDWPSSWTYCSGRRSAWSRSSDPAASARPAWRSRWPRGLAEWGDECRFVDLTEVRDARQVVPAIAAALGVREEPGRSLLGTMVEAVGSRSVMLVLDNVEQVVDAGPELAALLADCPGIRLLATSRSALRLRSGAPGPDRRRCRCRSRMAPGRTIRGAIAASPAVALFVERAQAVDPDFALTRRRPRSSRRSAPAWTACRWRSSWPRPASASWPPPPCWPVWTDGLPLLVGGAPDLPARQRTLRDAIAWSVALLTPERAQPLRPPGRLRRRLHPGGRRRRRGCRPAASSGGAGCASGGAAALRGRRG